MPHRFASRMRKAHKSFIREILKVTEQPDVISFAGGLPNPEFFPFRAMERAAVQVISMQGPEALQYSTTEGYFPLREWIAARYKIRYGMNVDPARICITTGSQQALDMVAKVLLNPGDTVLVERPGYLGAIQCFSLYEPVFEGIDLQHDGPDLNALSSCIAKRNVKLFYVAPTFQNPSGLSYSLEKRQAVADLLRGKDVMLLEDNPYGELRFAGQDLPPMAQNMLLDNAMLLGSFSKIVAPGMRVGWIVAPELFLDKLVLAKQAADLHTSTLAQRIVHRFLTDNDLEQHLAIIREHYGESCRAMLQAAEEFFPPEVAVTRPEGGMFLWARLPEGHDAMDLFNLAIEQRVAFVPGRPFHWDGSGENCFRLNFSNAAPDIIRQGMERLGACIRQLLDKRPENRQ